jgi:hypothetical protein
VYVDRQHKGRVRELLRKFAGAGLDMEEIDD